MGMAAQLSEQNPLSSKDQDKAVEKCISIFKSAKTDNERFAALLLVTRMVKSNDIDSSQRKRLFDAIGFTFLNRLLKTKALPESSLYQALAVAILTCFASDEKLLFHPLMVAKIPLFHQIIVDCHDGESIVDDAYEILIHYSSSVAGCQLLLKNGTVPFMVDVVVKEACLTEMPWKLLLNITCLVSVDAWNLHCKPLIHLVNHCAVKLKTLQDSDKFTYCRNLLSLLTHSNTEAFRNSLQNELQWLSDLGAGLGDILQGKVTSIQRDPAIVLISVVTDLMGGSLKWVFADGRSDSNHKADLFTLIVTSVCIEIRMILDECTVEEIIEKATLLTSCYNILESVIAHLIIVNDDDETEKVQGKNCKVPQELCTKLYSQVTEAMMSVLNFLQQQAVKFEEVICNEEKVLTFASARVICAWLAEESVALQKEVNKVLPFLIKLARDTMTSNNYDKSGEKSSGTASNVEILRFMLPALCHLSANETSRIILKDNAMHDILVRYFFVLWNAPPCTDHKTALLTLLGVLLNFAVTEPDLVKKDNLFHDLQTFIIVNLPCVAQSNDNLDVLVHVIVLGLMLLRHQKESLDYTDAKLQSFFKSTVLFLNEAGKLHSTASNVWSSISELWFLGVQVITQEFSNPDGQFAEILEPDVLQEMSTLSITASQL